jgi:hypothetical protein
MIPTLLWQCPVCHCDNALRQQSRWWHPDEVWCTRCGTAWELERVIGNDYRLTVIRGESSTLGSQQPLAAWYDLMKAGVRLQPREKGSLRLEAGEEVYVESREAELIVEDDNPLLARWDEGEAPSQKEGDLGLSFTKRWDRGQLFLTSERLLWTGRKGQLTFWLRRVNSVHTEVTWFFGVLYGLCSYKFKFHDESILKWLTYTALTAKRIEQRYQHRIAVSNY